MMGEMVLDGGCSLLLAARRGPRREGTHTYILVFWDIFPLRKHGTHRIF